MLGVVRLESVRQWPFPYIQFDMIQNILEKNSDAKAIFSKEYKISILFLRFDKEFSKNGPWAIGPRRKRRGMSSCALFENFLYWLKTTTTMKMQ